MINVTKVRVGYAQGYNSQSANKGRFVKTDASLKRDANKVKREFNKGAS